jgi:flagellar biosynthesis protein FliQ
MSSLFQIFIGAFLLSIVHSSIPNHWLSIVAISRSENWSIPEAMSVTAIAGTAHILSTLIVGIIIGIFGYTLSSSYEFITKVAAPLVLLILGSIYVLADIRENR